MRADYGDVKLQIERWYIIQMALTEPCHRMWHRCHTASDDPSLYPVEFTYRNWRIHDDPKFNPQWCCLCCLKIADPGLVGAYILLESDKTSREVQSVLKTHK
jgi:hypothetical protein